MTKSNPGHYFEDFKPGMELVHATPLTVSSGDISLYRALTGRTPFQAETAYSLIQAIRMRAHQEMLDRGEPLSNYINPDDLNPLDRRILRESFRQAQRLQQKLEITYQL